MATLRRAPPPRWPWLVLGALLASLAAAEGPRIEVEEGGWRLAELPPLVVEEEVRRHLETGLTSTLAFRVQARSAAGERTDGGARVDVRYELWDEVYQVVAVGIDGRAERRAFTSFDALEEWWRELRPLVFRAGEPPPPGPWQVRVTVELLPFSQAEQDDAQRWFSETLDRAGRSSAEEVARAADEGAESLSRVLNLVMATSIQRRALATYRWSLSVPAGAP